MATKQEVEKLKDLVTLAPLQGIGSSFEPTATPWPTPKKPRVQQNGSLDGLKRSKNII